MLTVQIQRLLDMRTTKCTILSRVVQHNFNNCIFYVYLWCFCRRIVGSVFNGVLVGDIDVINYDSIRMYTNNGFDACGVVSCQ